MIGEAVGHAQPVTTTRYAHLGRDPVRDMAEGVGKRITAAGADVSAGDVVALRK